MPQTGLYPSSLCLLLLPPLLLLSSASQPSNPYYVDCSKPVYCGNSFDITYPFRLLNENSPYCGYPGYELICDGDELTIQLDGEDYFVKDIFYEEKIIVVIDSYFMGIDCPMNFTSTTLNSSLFNYTSSDSNLTVYINCNVQIHPPPELLKIPCTNNSDKQSYYKVDDGPLTFQGNFQGACNYTEVVPVHVKNGTFKEAITSGFGLTWSKSTDWCQECMGSGGICGYNDSWPGDQICFCSDTNRPKYCPSSKRHKGLKKGVLASLLCLPLVCIPLYFCIELNKRLNKKTFQKNNKAQTIKPNKICNNFTFQNNKKAQTIEDFLDACEYLGPKRYKYSALKKITKSFSEKLGQGGFGAVFKGKFPDGRLVAVKVLSDMKGNGDEFVNEVASIGKTSHVNVVSLLGFCSEGSKRALIYEFLCNGSLEKYIYSDNLKFTLGWEKLYQISVGIARGLEYLHRGCNTRIVHFDIKPHNILLDQDFCPKISDFGLAQLCLKKDSIFSAVDMRGTIGYISPELFSRNFGPVSSKSDVYSYGMMILEMVGVRNVSHSSNESDSGYYFPHWIYEHFHQIGHMEGLDVTIETVEIVKKMILVGLWCIQTKPGSRPSMSKVLDMLQSSIDDLEMPPKPYLSSP